MLSVALAATHSYDTGTKQLTFNMKKGWNLLPVGIEGPPVFADNTSMGAVFIWIPVSGKYAGGIVKDGSVVSNDDYSQQIEAMKDYAPFSMWVYLKRDVSFTSYAITNQKVLTGEGAPTRLAKGWNFVAIWPFMVGLDVQDLFANCTITKANMWNAETQGWQQPSSTQAAQNMSSQVRESDVGETMLVYAASACELSLVEKEAMTPPALPE